MKLEELVKKCYKAPNGCKLYTGQLQKGYAKVTLDGKYIRLHRKVMEWHLGYEIPKGMVVHHTCENKHCFEVSHLKVLTKVEHGKEHHRLRCESGQDEVLRNTSIKKMTELWEDPEQREKFMANRKYDDEWREKVSAGVRKWEDENPGARRTGRKPLPTCPDCGAQLKDYRSKKCRSCGQKGKKYSKETLEKMSKAKQGKVLTKEHRRNISKSLTRKS